MMTVWIVLGAVCVVWGIGIIVWSSYDIRKGQLQRCMYLVKLLAKSRGIPRWLKALIVFGIAPVPFFLDEIALVTAAVILAIFYRPVLRDAWTMAAQS